MRSDGMAARKRPLRWSGCRAVLKSLWQFRRWAKTGKFDGLLALGCVIRGATSHYDHIASAVTSGISTVALEAELPVSFGVITVESIEQAIERAGSKAGNKGAEAALVAIEMAQILRQIRS